MLFDGNNFKFLFIRSAGTIFLKIVGSSLAQILSL